MLDIKSAVGATRYPGRGIIAGRTDGKLPAVIYFIMGRSENSRNRVFVKDGDGIRTEARDPKKMVDPSLIIYAPARVLNGANIVTNGDQTDTIYTALKSGGTFEGALRTRGYEPDAPNFTPRISCLMDAAGNYKLSILKHSCTTCQRYFFEYQGLAGRGHFIHTYKCDGNPIPSFEGEPEEVELKGGPEEIAREVWDALDPDNKVSLFVRVIGAGDVIINKEA